MPAKVEVKIGIVEIAVESNNVYADSLMEKASKKAVEGKKRLSWPEPLKLLLLPFIWMQGWRKQEISFSLSCNLCSKKSKLKISLLTTISRLCKNISKRKTYPPLLIKPSHQQALITRRVSLLKSYQKEILWQRRKVIPKKLPNKKLRRRLSKACSGGK